MLGAVSQPMRLLVVDDYPANVIALTAALRPLGAKVAEAFTASQAIATADREHFDGVLMDVRLPDLNGFDAWAKIRSTVNNRRTLVLFHSAEELTADEQRQALIHSPRGVLQKPIDAEVLVAEVLILLRKRS